MTSPSTDWEGFAAAVRDEVQAQAPDHVARLGWSAEQVVNAQRAGLRHLLAHAVEHSPFHGRRLAGVDVDRIERGDLSSLPVMTKHDMMADLDAVLTDRSLGRDRVEAALAATATEPVVIEDRYVAMASGGSSGERGVFVMDRSAMVAYISALSRPLRARLEAMGGPPPGGLQVGFVAAASPVHATGLAASLTLRGDLPFRFHSAPATLPLPEIVRRLNELRPAALFGYPSMLHRLVEERREGRLDITPIAITSSSEVLRPEVREALTDAFGVPVGNTFGSTEGLVGASAPGDEVLTFNSDLCIVELVDGDNRPVPPGTPSTKVLVTNLFNRVQPLIRYEMTDRFTRQPSVPEHGHLRARVEGRSEDVLHYEGVDVHPHVVRSVMVGSAEVTDYQVRQSRRGAEVDVVTTGAAIDVGDLADRLTRALTDAGLTEADVEVRVVDDLDRHPETGKIRRFVPLALSG